MRIILLGAPGSGKGTVSNFLCKAHNLMHISTGDLFRAALKKEDDFANQIKQFIVSGAYVPDWITNKIADDAITTANNEYAGFILDGYPRTINQADHLKDESKIDAVILLDVDEDTLFKRISGRRVCPNCNSIYNIYFEGKPKVENHCDKCGHELIQRSDDNPDVAKRRITVYLNQTKPLIDYYKQMNLLSVVDATQPIDKIMSEVKNILNIK